MTDNRAPSAAAYTSAGASNDQLGALSHSAHPRPSSIRATASSDPCAIASFRALVSFNLSWSLSMVAFTLEYVSGPYLFAGLSARLT